MFWLLVVFVFVSDPMGHGALAERQVLQPKIEANAAACHADQAAILTVDVPEGVFIGAKCDGPLVDPTVKANSP